MANELSHNPLNIQFRRYFTGQNWESWKRLVGRLMRVNLSNEKEQCVWNLMDNGSFMVQFMYMDYMHGHTPYLWKLKVPLKIKVFMWLLQRKIILTKDNLAKRNWT